ncbi:DUF4089 domain-containing protein [Acidithiobacillus sp. IBUN Pt1247-S3]|uniref:DUF4089 domain-containing protein n=1 Tax=Acidithiobacillus sp. IBUN Pt1247-S3 TaxID=3166642 RepID=UPI0034E3784C
MTDYQISPEELDRYLHQTSAVVGLPIAEEHAAGVKRYLQISLRMAAAMETMPLQMEDDFAPIFHA